MYNEALVWPALMRAQPLSRPFEGAMFETALVEWRLQDWAGAEADAPSSMPNNGSS